MKNLFFLGLIILALSIPALAKTPVPITDPDPTLSAINYKILSQMDSIRLALKSKKISKTQAASLWSDLQTVMGKMKQYMLAGNGKSLTLSQTADLNSRLTTISVALPTTQQ